LTRSAIAEIRVNVNELNWLGFGTILCLLFFLAWCLWAIDWRKAWPVLASGGWMPLVLIAVMTGAVALCIWPSDLLILGLFRAPNGLWQFGAAGLLVGIVLLCGSLQARSDYVPPQFDLDEPAHGHAHHDPHSHAH
jgi:hypothetical protein